MFRAYVLIIRRLKLYYTASGIITPTGVMVKYWDTYPELHGQQNVKTFFLIKSQQKVSLTRVQYCLSNDLSPS